MVAMKVNKLRGSPPSGSRGKEQNSKLAKKESWYEMAMLDAREQETYRRMLKGNGSSEIGHNIKVGIDSIS
jgi:hypothetical protein